MPRKRSKKQKVPEPIPKSEENIVKQKPIIIKTLTIGEEQLKALDDITYELYTRFIKADDEMIIVVYEVPTMKLTVEDQIRNWKLGLETALVQAANKKRLTITRDKFEFKALPKGEMTLIKAYFKMRDVTGGAGKEQHSRQQPPRGKEGLIIEG